MFEEKTSAVFGLNWARSVDPLPVTGAYDPEAELWTTSGPAQAAYDGGGTGPTLNILTQTLGNATATGANNSDTDQQGDGDAISDGVQHVPIQS